MGIVDEIIAEPLGGAHRNLEEISKAVKHYVTLKLNELIQIDPRELLKKRIEKYRIIGVFESE